MKLRAKIWVAVLVVLAAVTVIPIVRHYQLKAAVDRYRAELKEKGEPMELAQVIPPPVPPEQNSASNFLKAVSLLNTNENVLVTNPPPAMRIIAPGKALVGWQQPMIRDGHMTNSWNEIEAAISEETKGLYLLQQLPIHPIFDFNLDFTKDPAKIQLRHLAVAKKATLRLQASAILNLRGGNPDVTAKNIEAMLAMVNGLAHDRILITELVRIAMAQIALNASWEFLQATKATDKQLESLQHDWSGLEFIQAEERALELDRADDPISLAEWRSSNAALRELIDMWRNLGLENENSHKNGNLPKIEIEAKIFLWRYWWSYPDELESLKGYQVLLETVRFAETNNSLLAAKNQQDEKLAGFHLASTNMFWFSNPEEANFHSIISSGTRYSANIFDKVMKVTIARNMIVTAIALKRYQLKHGNYPVDLNSLVPEFLAAVPLDPVDGRPLRYRLNGDGSFALYSVGENGKDDGGNPALEPSVKSTSYQWQSPHALDWVWPQPATEAEIQKYFAEQAAKAE